MFFYKKCYINTTDDVDVLSIIHDVKYAIRDSLSPEGLLTVIIPKSGAGVVVMPEISEAVDELKASFDVFAGEGGKAKDRLKRELDIGPIVQSAIAGRTVHVPFQDTKLLIDPYDDILLIDFEKKGQRREFIIQIISEAPPQQAQQGKQAKRPAKR